MIECAKSGISRKLTFLQGILYWFGGFPAGARKIFADQPADLLETRRTLHGPLTMPRCYSYSDKLFGATVLYLLEFGGHPISFQI